MTTDEKKLENKTDNTKTKEQVETKLKEPAKPNKPEPLKLETSPKPVKEEVKVEKEESVKAASTPDTESAKTLTTKEVKNNLSKQVFPELPDSHPLKCNLCGSRPLSSGSGKNRTYRCPYNYPVSKCPSIRKFNIQQALKEKE